MGFWSNFWRETGRNTGKWISNKVFGNSGWATPRRHYINFEQEGRRGRLNLKSGAEDTITRSTDWELRRLDEMRQREELIKEVSQIQFNNNPDNVAFNLEKLLVILGKLDFNDNFHHAVRLKIEAGIKRLILLKRHDMAHFYKKQLNRLRRRRIITIIILISVLVGGWVIVFHWSQEKSSSPSFIIDEFLSLFK